jgi:peptide subunit release factor RF-3
MRICSGKFERGKDYLHVQENKLIKLSQPQQMMAQEREIINEAYAGDIIGVFDPGIFSIGDTICDRDMKVKYKGIMTFAPESMPSVRPVDDRVASAVVDGMSAWGSSRRVIAIVANVRLSSPAGSLPNGVEGWGMKGPMPTISGCMAVMNCRSSMR